MKFYIPFIITATLASHTAVADKPPVTEGLFLDLNANKGVTTEDGNRVAAWKNQVEGNAVDVFVKQDEGREKPLKKRELGIGSGRPTLKENLASIGGNSTLIFKEQELINHQEDAFDHMTQGSGYTWLSVMCAYSQNKGKPDVNSFFGNLTNGKPYAGFWGNFMDDNRVWMGTRTGADFGIKKKKDEPKLWHEQLNPQVSSKAPVVANQYYLIMGRMGAGTDSVDLELFIDNTTPVDKKSVPVVTDANPSKMAIGQERDATNHPGLESFDGEITRFMIYERPLTNEELKKVATHLKTKYLIKEKE